MADAYITTERNLAKLPLELLDRILDYFAPYYAKPFTVNGIIGKSSLSVESKVYDPVQILQEQQDRELGNISTWIWVCRTFAKSGRSRRFETIAIRCSWEGLEGPLLESHSLRSFLGTLWQINGSDDFQAPSTFVKRISLMVYGLSSLGQEGFEFQLQDARARTANIEREISQRSRVTDSLRLRLAHNQDTEDFIQKMMHRTDEHRRIIRQRIDEDRILSALKAFNNRLQQVRLMRVDDQVERGWEAYSSTRPELTSEAKHIRWALACKHAAEVLARAFLRSGFYPQRLSGRALPPETCLELTRIPKDRVSWYSKYLNTLELQFDNRANLDDELLELSSLFLQSFSAAANVQGLHIGFGRPVSIPFESIFHDVHWRKLQYIGLSSWRLSSADIIRFIRRHKGTLRSIRLRGVNLNEGSKWTDILKVLRQELKLKWASFRGVGYTSLEVTGVIVDDNENYDDSEEEQEDLHETESESSSNADESENMNQNGHIAEEEVQGADGNQDTNGGQSIEDQLMVDTSIEGEHSGMYDSEVGSEDGDNEPREAVNDLGIDDQTMVTHSEMNFDSPKSTCYCGRGYAWNDLRDDHGLNPDEDLWKHWQQWVVEACPTHDPPPA